MKILTINNINLEVVESNLELTASREKDVRQLYLNLIQYEKTPVEVISKCIAFFNKQMFNSLAQEMSNYLDFLQINKDINIYTSIFCLITFEKNEKKETLSNIEVLEKSKKLEKEGLTFEIVKREVENFLKAYPAIDRIYKLLIG